MFNRNSYRAAFAGVAPNSEFRCVANKNEHVMFADSNTETDDFNEFASSHQPRRDNRKSPRNSKKSNNKKVYEINPKTIIIAVVSLVAFILAVAVIVAIANAGGGNVTVENNAFTSFEQDGTFYVAMNGEVIEPGFDNKVEIHPAADNSFAYVIETSEEEDIMVYLLENKDITEVTMKPATAVLALAELSPGVVFRENDIVKLYTKESEDRIIKDATADNFVIAQDASVVAYTIQDPNNQSELKLYLYIDGVREHKATNMIPVEISKGGKYIYASKLTEDFTTKKLYLIKPLEEDSPIEIDSSTNFNGILCSNIKCDEIVYTVGSPESGYITYLYNAKKEQTFKIGGGICTPLLPGNNVAKLSSFKDCVFENVFFAAKDAKSATYYLNKNYESNKLSSYNGQLDSNGGLFYYIDANATLYSVKVASKKLDSQEIASGVKSFIITEKDNIFYVDDQDSLLFCKGTGENKKTIDNDVIEYSFNSYSNVIYFKVLDGEHIYSSEEGSKREEVMFDHSDVLATPNFLAAGQKRTFVAVYNPETELYDLYYTSTGKTFEMVESDCASIGALVASEVVNDKGLTTN